MRLMPQNKSYGKDGFTLVELLVTASIVVIVSMAVYMSFQQGVFGARDINRSVESSQMVLQALGRMSTDFRNSFEFSKTKSLFLGQKGSIGFLTLVNTYTDVGNVRELSYVSYVVNDGKLTRMVRRGKSVLEENAAARRDELVESVQELSFSYGSYSSDTKTLVWKEEWDRSTSLPQVIKVKLVVNEKTGNRTFERSITRPVDGLDG